MPTVVELGAEVPVFVKLKKGASTVVDLGAEVLSVV